MTSQLVLGNGSGIVLASDSAITIRGGRTFESFEKVYGLPGPHRLAVMLSGNALYSRIPIEVLVKEWIRSLSDNVEASVEDYREDFVSWIGNRADRWQSASGREVAAWNSLVRELGNLTDWLKRNLDGAEEEESPADLVLANLRRINEDDSTWSSIVSSSEAESIIDRWWEPDNTLLSPPGSPRPGLEKVVGDRFDGIPRSETIDQEIRTYLRLVVEKAVNFPETGGRAHLIFVGYGVNDLLPTLARLDLYGGMGKKVWSESHEPTLPRFAGASYALIQSAAQDETIDLILFGYDRGLARTGLSQALDSVLPFDQGPEETDLSDQGPEEAESPSLANQRFRKELIEKHDEEMDALTRAEFFERAMATVAVMPLLDLADAAKALVAVQVLTLDIKGKLPSVGGHIDVASITPDEGFRWISHGKDG